MGLIKLFTTKNFCDGIFLNIVDVRFGKACDNNCTYCIDKQGRNKTSDKIDVDSMLRSIDTIKYLDDMTISGGEPFLKPRELIRFIEGVKAIFPRVNIYINTALPRLFIDHPNMVREIMKHVKGLNISMNHYSEDLNRKILQASSNHNRLPILQELCRNYPGKIRVSFNLVKGYIDTYEKVSFALGVFTAAGVTHIRVRELFHADKEYVSYEKISGVKLPEPFALGCVTIISKEDHPVKVELKRSCFAATNHRYANWRDLLKIIYMKLFKNRFKKEFYVLYEDGSMFNDWW